MSDEEATTTISRFNWPPAYAPARAALHVVNRLDTPTGPDIIWQRLIDARNWPSLYANARDVMPIGGDNLAAAQCFTWRSFGFRLSSRILICQPQRQLMWEATGFGIRACHGWLIAPRADGGSEVVTEETQTGWMARLFGRFIARDLQRWHQRWLEGLATGERR